VTSVVASTKRPGDATKVLAYAGIFDSLMKAYIGNRTADTPMSTMTSFLNAEHMRHA
jgi:hypothetical protein